jgi:hypothetical protein
MPRPATFTDEQNQLLDWFSANGVDEYLPECFGPIEIDAPAGTLTYTAFTVEPGTERGWSYDWIGVGTQRRTIPLVKPLDPDTRALIAGAAEQLVVDRSEALGRKRQSAGEGYADRSGELAAAEHDVAEARAFAATPVVYA